MYDILLPPGIQELRKNLSQRKVLSIFYLALGKVKHELPFADYEFRLTIYEFKSTSYEFKSMSYQFKTTSYEFISTS